MRKIASIDIYWTLCLILPAYLSLVYLVVFAFGGPLCLSITKLNP